MSPGRTSPGRKAQERQADYAERGKHAAQIKQQKVQAKVTMHDFKNQEVFVRTKAGETTTGKIKLNLPLKQQVGHATFVILTKHSLVSPVFPPSIHPPLHYCLDEISRTEVC
jgi:hypothetical protein